MTEKESKLTDIAWLAGIGLMLGYEIWTLTNKKKNDTLSESVWKASAKVPLVPYAIGLLTGHFVWQSKSIYDRYREEERS